MARHTRKLKKVGRRRQWTKNRPRQSASKRIKMPKKHNKIKATKPKQNKKNKNKHKNNKKKKQKNDKQNKKKKKKESLDYSEFLDTLSTVAMTGMAIDQATPLLTEEREEKPQIGDVSHLIHSDEFLIEPVASHPVTIPFRMANINGRLLAP